MIQHLNELVKKGWRFQITGDRNTWHCHAVGTGLAEGRGAAPDLMLATKIAIEACGNDPLDDPQVFLKTYGDELRRLAIEHFGVKFRRLAVEESDENGPKKVAIVYRYPATATEDPKNTVDRELVFWKEVMEHPQLKTTIPKIKITIDWEDVSCPKSASGLHRWPANTDGQVTCLDCATTKRG